MRMREPRKSEFISCYYRERTNAGDSPVIDDRTWADLDMDAVFQKLDRTRSSVGQARLYDMMRRPLFDGAALTARTARIRGLMDDPRGRLKLTKVFSRLGVQREGEVYQFLSFMRTRIEDKKRYLFLALSVLAFIAIPAAILLGLKGLVLLAVVAIVHPLLEAPVANSLSMHEKGIVITGSNMSGKSTFLRTIGVNQVLATTICAAFALRLRTSALLTVTSITNRDNLLASESHYLVEAKRLLDILAAARGEHPALVIIDEILSGTNSEERIAASIRILRHLAGLNCRVVAATHDRAIAADLEGAYKNLHFTHRVEKEGLEFDYKLRDGIVEAGNAIRLLRLLGYPAQILEDL